MASDDAASTAHLVLALGLALGIVGLLLRTQLRFARAEACWRARGARRRLHKQESASDHEEMTQMVLHRHPEPLHDAEGRSPRTDAP
mmetsp:Transcript_11888/g.30251  ORF Transcript_11888/g.30251 Transcript_11888/m.30251 type:complete len:87 (-) Transcript_11888:209-469(-)